MSQSEKAAYYQALKSAGVSFDRHYREYSTEELKAAYDALQTKLSPPVADAPAPSPADEPQPVDAEAAAFYGFDVPETPAPAPTSPSQPTSPSAPVRGQDPDELPGQRLNTKDEDEPIRTDEEGRIWLQEEIRKPAFPKPRGRRVLTYMDSGVETRTVKDGQGYTESFEVAGDPRNARPAEVKITLPSYQVGIFRDPRFPFKVHTYNGLQAFDLFEVQDYYGGAELVPPSVKRVYVENVLCYDIRSTVQAIEDEYRRLQLTGAIQ